MKGSHGFGLTMNASGSDLLPRLHKKGNGCKTFCLRELMAVDANGVWSKKRDDWCAFESTR